MDIIQKKRTVQIMGKDAFGETIGVKVSVKTLLRSVTSVNEVAECWHKNRKYVQRLCQTGQFSAEKVGGQWILPTQEVVLRWGEPLVKFEDYRHE